MDVYEEHNEMANRGIAFLMVEELDDWVVLHRDSHRKDASGHTERDSAYAARRAARESGKASVAYFTRTAHAHWCRDRIAGNSTFNMTVSAMSQTQNATDARRTPVPTFFHPPDQLQFSVLWLQDLASPLRTALHRTQS